MIKKIFIITILMLFGCSEKDSNSNSVSVTGVVKTSAGVVENASVSLNDLIQSIFKVKSLIYSPYYYIDCIDVYPKF